MPEWEPDAVPEPDLDVIPEPDEAFLAPPLITLHHDPLAPQRHLSYEAEPGRTLIDWLTEFYPLGFGGPVEIHRNGRRVDLADADFVMQPGDTIQLLVQPGLPAALGAFIVQALITAAISAVLSIGLSLVLGKPKQPRAQDQAAPDPTYSITAAQNAARVGEPVPVLYGHMVTVPDFASQPYVYFDNNNNNQYLAQLLVIGQGEYDLHDVQVGETPVSAMESGAVTHALIGPGAHLQAMGAIEALTGIMENVVTSPEVADQELTGLDEGDPAPPSITLPVQFTAPSTIYFGPGSPVPNVTGVVQVYGSPTTANNGFYTIQSMTGGNTIVTVEPIVTEAAGPPVTLYFFTASSATLVGPFITSKPGTRGNRIMLDFVWPGGLYQSNEKTGALETMFVSFNIECQMIDDAGAPLGGWIVFPIGFSAATNTPRRRTWSFDLDPGRYLVRVRRTSAPSANTRQVSNFVWTGLKFRLLPSGFPVYGPVTLLAIRIRATNGIAGAASSRIRAEVTRRLPPMGVGAAVPSTSPADAFVDVYSNTVYGARRPLAELDLAEIARLSAHWAGGAAFNGGFSQKSTIWEALTLVVQTAGAAPAPVGQVMSLTQDGVRAIRTQLFSDANMVRDSLSIGYSFDRPGDNDGVEVEYRDPETFNPLHATWPPGALEPDRVTLFGCTDPADADGFARLLWNKQQKLRRTARFETELEGLLARRGDRIAVATRLPRWGRAGVVVAVSGTGGGTTLLLDEAIDWTGSGHFVVLRDEHGAPSDPIAVTPGARAHELVLAAPPPFAIFGTGDQEPTHYAFGNAVELLRDFTVTNMEPRGGARVGIEAVIYDPSVYAGTLPWMEVPV